MGVSKNRVYTPKSSTLTGFSIINHPFWVTPFLETPISCGNFHLQGPKPDASPRPGGDFDMKIFQSFGRAAGLHSS